MERKSKKVLSEEKPDIFEYHDYRLYLKNMMRYQSLKYGEFTLKSLSEKSQVKSSLLSMILNNRRNMTKNVFESIVPFFRMNETERSFLKALIELSDSNGPSDRDKAYRRLLKFQSYKEKGKGHIAAHDYIKSWLNITIREMAALPGFELDNQWIKERLKTKVANSKIKESIQFLIKEGMIIVDDQGEVTNSEKFLNCDGGIYRLGLSQVHSQFLELAIKSIYETDRDYRNIKSLTFPIPKKKFDRIKQIMDKAYSDIQAVTESVEPSERNMVYHVALYSFPLTKLDIDE